MKMGKGMGPRQSAKGLGVEMGGFGKRLYLYIFIFFSYFKQKLYIFMHMTLAYGY